MNQANALKSSSLRKTIQEAAEFIGLEEHINTNLELNDSLPEDIDIFEVQSHIEDSPEEVEESQNSTEQEIVEQRTRPFQD